VLPRLLEGRSYPLVPEVLGPSFLLLGLPPFHLSLRLRDLLGHGSKTFPNLLLVLV
jgi:hypothetical protein